MQTSVERAAALHPNAGRPALPRLNRTELANVIHDLLNVDVDVTPLLPADDMSHGFDNMAVVLTISPALMQGYIRAPGRINREAIRDATALSLPSTVSLSPVLFHMRPMSVTPFPTR